jgi:hypothetical protein
MVTILRFLRPPRKHPLQVLVDDPLAQIPDDAGEKLFLAAKIPIDRHLRNAGRGGDPVHAGPFETVPEENVLRATDNVCPLDVEARHRGRCRTGSHRPRSLPEMILCSIIATLAGSRDERLRRNTSR